MLLEAIGNARRTVAVRQARVADNVNVNVGEEEDEPIPVDVTRETSQGPLQSSLAGAGAQSSSSLQ